MKQLLEVDFPLHYGVARRPKCEEIVTNKVNFDLIDDKVNYVVDYRKGYASFCDNIYQLSVIGYDKYVGEFAGTSIEKGKRRCDFIISDVATDNIIILCELTSSIGSTVNLSLPITKSRKDGTTVVVFPRGKYQKAELQLYQTLDNIMRVPSICSYVTKKNKKVCLMAYKIIPSQHNAVNIFNRNRLVEAEEAGENGAQISLPQVEKYGFSYFRISHQYSFKIS